jgi:class 3 adenylate cyclase/CHASE2 domain-containing sensor protein
VKRHFGKLIPAFLCAAVIALMAVLQWFSQTRDRPRWLQALEGMTYDWRVNQALDHPAPVATNLGVISINEDTIHRVSHGAERYGFEADLYWPRHVYGRLIQELDMQGAEGIGFDVLFPELRSTNETAKLPDGETVVTSDHYFALQMQSAGNVILAAQISPNQETVFPPRMFAVTAWAVGDITAPTDPDGVLRRVEAFHDYVVWDDLVTSKRYLDGFTFNTNRIRFQTKRGDVVEIPIAPDGVADLTRLLAGAGSSSSLQPSTRTPRQAFIRYRAWNLGLAAAAIHLNFDLAQALIEPGRRITLRNSNGVERVLPIDHAGRLLIDWNLRHSDPRLTHETFHSLLDNWADRHKTNEVGEFKTNHIKELWRGKLAFVGSLASGNDLLDTGTTPLGAETFLTASLWNLANSLITGRFITQARLSLSLGLISFLGLLAAWVTWKSRTLAASLIVTLIGVAYGGTAIYAYVHSRYWLPMVVPLAALLCTHFALLTYRVIFEQRERRRIRSIFSRMVSPNIVAELLKAEKLSLSTRREVTVFFSDVRGFTEMTDESHARSEEHVKAHNLLGSDAEAYFDGQAQEVLATVNCYLSAIADKVKEHEGTFDKYIGDCVMAFWGAPTPNAQHAVACVRAAIDAQRTIAALNEDRVAENQRREQENASRPAQGLEPLPLLKPLFMGAGINTGIVTVGLMGSDQHQFNYTVFGREVNLASRLEGLSGRGRIVISESTYHALQRGDPELATSCRELPAAHVKGFRTAVKVYEVPWKRIEGSLTFESEHVTIGASGKTAG